MDCARCRSFLSDFMEASLPPRTRAEVAAHVGTCSACAAELRNLAKTLAFVRAAPTEAPPAGLAGAVVARLGREVEALAVLELKARAAGRTSRRIAAAAAVLCLGVTLAAGLREGWWRMHDRADASKLASVRGENESLRAELAAAQGRVTTAADDAAAARKAAEERGHEIDRALARIKDESVARDREVAELKDALTLARKETEQLAAEVVKQSAARAKLESRPVESIATTPPPGGERKASVLTEAPLPERKNVIIVARGDQLELRTRGPRDKVITELLAVAADETNPATANLALNALENLLGRGTRSGAPEGAEPRATGIMGWLDQRLDGVPEAAGNDDTSGSTDEPSDRRRILAELRETWRREQEKNKE